MKRLWFLAVVACGSAPVSSPPIGNTGPKTEVRVAGPETALPGDARRVVFERSGTALTDWLPSCERDLGKLEGTYVAMTDQERVVVATGPVNVEAVIACASTFLTNEGSRTRKDGDHRIWFAGNRPGVPPFHLAWGERWLSMTLLVDERELPAPKPEQLVTWARLREFSLGVWSRDPVLGTLTGVAGGELVIHASKYELTSVEWERSITGTLTMTLRSPQDAKAAAANLAAYTVGPLRDPKLSGQLKALPYKLDGNTVKADLDLTFTLGTLISDLVVYTPGMW